MPRYGRILLAITATVLISIPGNARTKDKGKKIQGDGLADYVQRVAGKAPAMAAATPGSRS